MAHNLPSDQNAPWFIAPLLAGAMYCFDSVIDIGGNASFASSSAVDNGGKNQNIVNIGML